MAEFKWNEEDAEAVILQHQPRTAVYSSATGNVIVRQEADAMQERDDLIYLTPQGALAIAWAMIDEAHLVGLPEPSLSLMVESAHWPPVTKRLDRHGTRRPHFPEGPEPDSGKADTPGQCDCNEPGIYHQRGSALCEAAGASDPGPLPNAMQDAAV